MGELSHGGNGSVVQHLRLNTFFKLRHYFSFMGELSHDGDGSVVQHLRL